MESICDFLGIEHEPMGDVEEQIGGAIEQDDWHPRQEEIFEVAMECSDPKGDDMKAALKTAKKQFPIRIR